MLDSCVLDWILCLVPREILDAPPKNLLEWVLPFFLLCFAVASVGFELAPCWLLGCQTPCLPTEPWTRSLRTAWNIMQ
jgi:hypothetical protein